jgi:hypothetical protein
LSGARSWRIERRSWRVERLGVAHQAPAVRCRRRECGDRRRDPRACARGTRIALARPALAAHRPWRELEMNGFKGTARSCAVGLALAVVLGGCGSEGMNSSEATGVDKAAFAAVKGDVGYVLSTATSGTITANSTYSYNSAGGTNTITVLGTGQYRVDMPNLGSTFGGDVQVTGYGNGDKYCKVVNWGSNGSTLQIFVNCFSNNGLAATSFFYVNYLRRTDAPGAEGAYVWAFDPSSASYDAGSAYSWNSSGGANTITHTPGSNTYAVTLAGQNLNGGTVEVTAYGSGNAYCKVVNWGFSTVNVACFSAGNGLPVESRFDLVFSTASPNGTPSSSFAWADQPSASSYHPSSSYALGLISIDCCSTPQVVSTAPTITRTNVGRYTVRLPSMASPFGGAPSNVKVTAYGTDSVACMITSVSTSGADGLVNVYCFDALGPAVDSRYTITYSSFAYLIG